MRRIHVGLIAIVLCAAGVVWAASSNKVVTNPTPAVSATMELAASADSNGCFTWNVSGKLKPSYRGFGSSIQLVCQKFRSIGTANDLLVFPNEGQCDGPCAAQADACGNFSFQIHTCGVSPQLDNSYYCSFIAHVDAAQQPQACSVRQTRGDMPEDPSGSAPCSGGFCPEAP
jgi:hypothetical protein